MLALILGCSIELEYNFHEKFALHLRLSLYQESALPLYQIFS